MPQPHTKIKTKTNTDPLKRNEHPHARSSPPPLLPVGQNLPMVLACALFPLRTMFPGPVQHSSVVVIVIVVVVVILGF